MDPVTPGRCAFKRNKWPTCSNWEFPVRGICLGHQLLGLALGGEIVRLPFGQRGINHPCFDRESGRVVITSQNHGYALEREALVKNAERPLFISHESLFDGSVEGMSSTDSFVRSVQFHPEGPSRAARCRFFF